MSRPSIRVLLSVYCTLLFIFGFTVREFLVNTENSLRILRSDVVHAKINNTVAKPAKTNEAQYTRDRLIVISRYKEDVTWVPVYLGNIPFVVYSKEDPLSVYKVPLNQGGEATVYLQFILDNYDDLPRVTAFLHAHRSAWHTSGNIDGLIQHLNWDARGYFNLAEPGIRTTMHINVTKGEENAPWGWMGNNRPADGNNDFKKQANDLINFWDRFMKPEIAPVTPKWVAATCCAQFVVHRDRILAHPRSFYLAIYEWLQSGVLETYWSGRVLEYSWHVIFGEDAEEVGLSRCQITKGLPGCNT